MFHVADLNLHFEPNENSKKKFKPLPELLDGTKDFEVEKVVARQVINGIVQYQLRFKGYPAAYDLWHPESALPNCKELIQDFLDTQKDPVVVQKNAVKRQKKATKTPVKAPAKRATKKGKGTKSK